MAAPRKAHRHSGAQRGGRRQQPGHPCHSTITQNPEGPGHPCHSQSLKPQRCIYSFTHQSNIACSTIAGIPMRLGASGCWMPRGPCQPHNHCSAPPVAGRRARTLPYEQAPLPGKKELTYVQEQQPRVWIMHTTTLAVFNAVKALHNSIASQATVFIRKKTSWAMATPA